MRPRGRGLAVAACLTVGVAGTAWAGAWEEPNFLHGMGQVLDGVLFELPKTVLDATLTEPPVIGTIVGLLAGTVRALQKTFGGVQEMAIAFNPWGGRIKR